MVSLSFPALNCASASDISRDDFDSLSSPTSSVSSFELASVSDSAELEDWSIMSLNDQFQSLSDLRLDDVQLINKHPNYYIAGGDVVFLVSPSSKKEYCANHAYPSLTNRRLRRSCFVCIDTSSFASPQSLRICFPLNL